MYRGLCFKGFPYKQFPRSELWAAKKPKKGLNSPEFPAGNLKGMRFAMGQGLFRMRLRATSFKSGVSLHHDWLGGKCPKLLPLLNQESVAPTCAQVI